MIGKIIVDTEFFQDIGDSDPVRRSESGGLGNPLGPVVPSSDVVINRKINPRTIKRITNFVLEVFIYYEL